jgi:hypothetical protein
VLPLQVKANHALWPAAGVKPLFDNCSQDTCHIL